MTGFPRWLPEGSPSGSLRVFPSVIKPAFIQQWNFTLEYRLPGDIVLSSGYVGEDATHLMMANRYYSQAPLGTGPLQQRRRAYAILPLATEIVVTDPRSKMNYQGFQNSLQKRFSSGLEFLVSYTWSHAMSDNAGYYGTSLNSTANPQDYGNSERHLGTGRDGCPAQFRYVHELRAAFRSWKEPFFAGAPRCRTP